VRTLGVAVIAQWRRLAGRGIGSKNIREVFPAKRVRGVSSTDELRLEVSFSVRYWAGGQRIRDCAIERVGPLSSTRVVSKRITVTIYEVRGSQFVRNVVGTEHIARSISQAN